MDQNQLPPENEQDRLIRENKWSYELVSLVLIVLAVAVYFILSGGIGGGGATTDLDMDNGASINQPIVPAGSGDTTQPIIPPNNGGTGAGTLD